MSIMIIAFVYDAVYPYVKGGVEKRLYEVGRRLVDNGHDVHWFGVKWWEGSDVINHNGITLHGVCPKQKLYTKSGRRTIRESVYFSFRLLVPMMRLKFDVIDCQQFPYFPCFSAKFISLIKREPLIVTWHEFWGDYWYDYLGRKGIMGKIIERIVCKLSNHVIAVSDKVRRELRGAGVKEVDIEVVPNGIDMHLIDGTLGADEGFDILFVGRLIKDKNVDVLLRSLKNVGEDGEITCGIIGEGPEKNRLIELAVQLGIENRVKFMGFMDRYEDVISYMKSSRIFVSPSTREGFGITVLEAMACGMPVITTNHKRNAASELVRENGFAVELSEKNITDKIVELLGNKELYCTMSKNSVNAVAEYDWLDISERLGKLYETCQNRRF